MAAKGHATVRVIWAMDSVHDVTSSSPRRGARTTARAAATRRREAEGLLVVDRDGRVVEVNRSIERLLGLDRDDVVGRRVEDVEPLMPLAAPLRTLFRIRDVEDDTAEAPVQLTVARAEGTDVLEALLTGAPTPGGPTVVVVIRPASHPAVGPALGGGLLDALGHATPDALCVVDDRGRVVHANGTALRLLGVEAGRLLDARLHDLVHDADARRDHDCWVDRVLGSGVTHFGEDELARGTVWRQQVTYGCAPICDAGRVAGAVVTFQDAGHGRLREERVRRLEETARDERRAAEEARQETRRMAGLEEAKTRFLSIASHELRNPLTVLGGYLSMLGSGTFGEVPADMRGVLPLLGAKVAQMNALVDGMLETARLDDGRLELSPRRHDLREVVGQAVASVGPLRRASHDLVVQLPDEPLFLDVDATRIGLVVGNLVHNAIKYSPHGGTVTVTVSGDATRAVVTVRDQGLGIAPEDQARLFTRFGRITTPETSAISGTGLGLYLSRQLARMHDGDIVVSSTVGVGSTFSLLLPRSRQAPAPAPLA